MNKLRIGIFTILLFISCGNEAKIKKDLSKLMSNSITFPNESIITINGKDSLVTDYFESDYKMVIYIDSEGCTSCEINKMILWDPLIAYSKTFKGKLKFYFIFATHQSVKIRNTLSTNLLNYPALIDEKGEFEKLNPHLPKNKAMHSFLLDENNNVIMVGNPIYNKEIEKLFYQHTQELLR